MCGIAGMHGVWGEESAESYPPASPLPCRTSSMASTQLGIREGFTDVSHPRFLFVTETERPQFSTLVPPLLYML